MIYPANFFAQSNYGWVDFGYYKKSDAWFTSENAAGLNNVDSSRVSVIETFANKGQGNFINYFQSSNSYVYGGLTESFYRLNQRTVFYGKVHYSRFNGEEMGGSALIDPYYNPMNIIEYADSTAGIKSMDTYHLVGGFGTRLSDKLSLGLKMDYKTVSYFKTRDLRHVNDLLDMSVTAGFRYKWGRLADIGINYYYRRSIESIVFSSAGNTDQQFNSLISFGSFLGMQERFSLYGYTASGNKRPYFNEFHGLTVQFELLPDYEVRLFNEVGVKFRNGYFGERSASSIVYTEHQADIFQYKGVVSIAKDASLHLVEANLKRESLENYENVYRRETIAGEASIIEYYGQNKVLDQTIHEISLVYTGNLRIENNYPVWVFSLGTSYGSRKQTTIVYPVYRKQEMNLLSANLFVKRNLIIGNNLYGLHLGSSYATGSGVEKNDGQYGSSSGSQSSAATLDHYLYREFEFLTAERMNGNIGFRYARLIDLNKSMIYADLGYCTTKAFSVSAIGDQYHQFMLTLGYAF